MLDGREIVLGVTGSIAAYKAVLLLRELTGAGARVTVCLSGNAKHFVDTGLDNGKKYNYVLTTFDAAGNSSATGKSAVPDGSSHVVRT